MKYILWATALGALSAASLPLGSWFGIQFRFSARTNSIMAAFGAGALIAALSIELIAPTVSGLLEASDGAKDDHVAAFFSMIVGCIGGGILYVALANLVNSKGGFLRKRSTVLGYFKKQNKINQEAVLERISGYPLFQNFPPEHVETLMDVLHEVYFAKGDLITEEGEEADTAYILLEGEIEGDLDDMSIGTIISKGDILNLLPVLKGGRSYGNAIAITKVRCLAISRAGFDKLRLLSREFDENCRNLAHEHLRIYARVVEEQNAKRQEWLSDAGRSLDNDMIMPDYHKINKAKKEHAGAPLAIWLGILLDGIPESMVIGAGMLGLLSAKLSVSPEVQFIDVIPFTLIAGLFLSNFPEALSSSANMKAQGTSKSRIFLMWFSLMVITGIGAGAGFLLADQFDHTVVVFLEGLAAGAMLTMIVAAMIPEAVLQGSGNLVGLSTLSGFLAALMFKLLE